MSGVEQGGKERGGGREACTTEATLNLASSSMPSVSSLMVACSSATTVLRDAPQKMGLVAAGSWLRGTERRVCDDWAGFLRRCFGGRTKRRYWPAARRFLSALRW